MTMREQSSFASRSRVFADSPRLAVPPRHLAATITAQAVLRAGWAIAGTFLFISLVVWVALWVDRGYGVGAFMPLAALCAIAAALTFLILRPGPRSGVLFLSVGAVATYFWVFGVLSLEPILNIQGIYLVNRMTVVLLLVGAVSSRLIHGVLWCTAGWLLGSIATALAQLSLGLPIVRGYGPFISLLLYIVVTVMFVLIKRSQSQFSSAFTDMQVEPARITGLRELEERAVGLLHDTLLNDLVALTLIDDELDERTSSRFRRDIRKVREASVESERPHNGDVAVWLRQDILSTVSDFQWRGLRVDITGDATIPTETSPHVAEAIGGAIREGLENVLRHSSSESAELFLDSSDTELSVMIADHGIGFDTSAVSKERLGVRQSIIQRVEAVGGSVRIWSAEGAGTSVVIAVPLRGAHE